MVERRLESKQCMHFKYFLDYKDNKEYINDVITFTYVTPRFQDICLETGT